MSRILQLIGLITCLLGLFYGGQWLFTHFSTVVIYTLATIGGLSILYLIVRLFYGQQWMMGLGKQFLIGSDLIKATEAFLSELPTPSKAATAALIGHLVYRFTRLGLVGLALAGIPIWLLFNQNQLINKQNEFIATQTKRLDQQTHLQEAERRSALVFLFSNIMDAVYQELREDVEVKGKRDLTPQLIGRIIALSTRLKPYRYLQGDTLTSESLSPERGQLLVSLVESQLDSITMDQIYQKADFRDADLGGANLTRAYLRGTNLTRAYLTRAYLLYANLRGANLRGANLIEANLIEANLTGANLTGANLIGAYLIGANLTGSNLREANLREADLREADLFEVDLRIAYLIGANLTGANLTGSNLTGSDLIEANLREANLREADLFEVDLRIADLTGANLRGAYLSLANLGGANLGGANLIGANLIGAYLIGVYLTGANLTGADLRRANLFDADLDSIYVNPSFLKDILSYGEDSIKGTAHILKTYEMDSLANGGEISYFLKRKQQP